MLISDRGGGAHSNPLQYFCLENPHGQRNLVDCTLRSRNELGMTERLSIYSLGNSQKREWLFHFLGSTVDKLEHLPLIFCKGSPVGSVTENPPANAGDTGLIPGSGRAPGGGNENSLQYACPEISMNRGAWRATVQGVTKSQTQLREWSCHMYMKMTQECKRVDNQSIQIIVDNLWPLLEQIFFIFRCLLSTKWKTQNTPRMSLCKKFSSPGVYFFFWSRIGMILR